MRVRVEELIRVSLSYLAGKMLKQAGEAAIKRWFIADKATYRIDILGRIEDLYYDDISNDAGTSRALIAVKVHIRAMWGKVVLTDKDYESGKLHGDYFKRSWGLIGSGKEYDAQYSRIVYRALLVTLDQSMQEVASKAKEKGLVR